MQKRFVILFTLFISGLFAPASSQAEKPTNAALHVILISIDTLRADYVGPYKNKMSANTPNITSFARESSVFKNAFANAGWTTPSHMSMLTGLLPSHHKVVQPNIYTSDLHFNNDRQNRLLSLESLHSLQILDKKYKTIAEVTKEHGIYSAWFAHSMDVFLDLALGFGRGFDEIQPLGFESDEGVSRINEWLEKNKEKNFFVFMHTKTPHFPYANEKITGEDFLKIDPHGPPVGPVNVEDWAKLKIPFAKEEFMEKIGKYLPRGACSLVEDSAISSVDTIEKMASFLNCKGIGRLKSFRQLDYYYKFNVARADEQVGKILDKIRQLGLFKNSVVILTSDHGEGFFEHGTLVHGHSLYNELLHIPLIIHLPSSVHQEIRPLVQTLDIFPTVLDYLHIKNSENQIDGKSMRPLMEGSQNGDDFVFAVSRHRNSDNAMALQSMKWKLIAPDSGSIELYDLVRDPSEEKNIAKDNIELVNSLVARLVNTRATSSSEEKK